MSPLVLAEAPNPAPLALFRGPEAASPPFDAPADGGERLTDPRFARLNRVLLGFRVALYVSLCASLVGLDPRPGPALFAFLGVLALVPAIQVKALERFRVETGVSIGLAVNAVAHELEAIWQQLDPPPGWTIDINGDGRATADRLRTRHLIKNLLDNSVRHGHPPVFVEISPSSGYVVCSLHDAGGGVDPEVEERLFHEYEPEAAPTRAGSTGLGLRIARILARYMGGDLRYLEGPFVLSLPAEGE